MEGGWVVCTNVKECPAWFVGVGARTARDVICMKYEECSIQFNSKATYQKVVCASTDPLPTVS